MSRFSLVTCLSFHSVGLRNKDGWGMSRHVMHDRRSRTTRRVIHTNQQDARSSCCLKVDPLGISLAQLSST
jgi:hypothetical protein